MKIEALSFGYGNKYIFQDFYAETESGIICIMGPSGCGKTTLLHLMAGLLRPDSGRITGFPEKRSLMFQEDRLLPWLDARANVALVLGENDDPELPAKLLRDLGIDPEMDIRSMSGGMRRRVALARALAFDSDALLLDEPFKGLDEELMRHCAELIRRTGKSALVSTHSEAEAETLGAGILKIKCS